MFLSRCGKLLRLSDLLLISHGIFTEQYNYINGLVVEGLSVHEVLATVA